MPSHIFVLGLDELNLKSLHQLPHLSQYRFHPLLSVDELTQADEINLAALLDRAQRQLDAFEPDVDAIIGYWDFPVSSMVPILCQRLGLPTTPLEAVVKCEHKYWSRLEQQQVIDELPRFGLVHLDESPRPPEGMRFPMWLKPVKSFASDLAYKVHDQTELERAAETIRHGIGRVGEPFDYLLEFLDLPTEIAEAGGQACLAEETIEGQQITVEGYVHKAEVHVYGLIDSINYEGTSSFQRYQYPSQLPEEISNRLIELSTRVIEHIGLDDSTFNIEYFYNPDTATINLLEINPRLSQSHAKLFEAVDGVPNHQCIVRLALGQDPELSYRQGEFSVAAKCFHRRFTDATVRRVPTPAELDRLHQDIPGVTIEIVPKEGTRLSDLPGQDSYSYELANLFIGASNPQQLTNTYHQCVRELHFEFE